MAIAATRTALAAGNSRVTCTEAVTVILNDALVLVPAGVSNVPTVVADLLINSGYCPSKAASGAGVVVGETLSHQAFGNR